MPAAGQSRRVSSAHGGLCERRRQVEARKGSEEWRVIRLAHRGILLGFVQANDKVEVLRKANKKLTEQFLWTQKFADFA
jgi:hypothetical protein